MTNQNNNQGDRPTELEKLIKEARGRCDHHYSQCGGECTNGVVRMINEAYKLGALAAIEATKNHQPSYACAAGSSRGEDMTDGYFEAKKNQQKLSDAFLNSLNSNQQRDE